ncbi:MAG: hypothetical protein QNJ72_06860 [Pleurocapsa sp. MO_226.B13]|nr:hypothetical protein [Pleurocapsa sp. MO_226.B13]
MAILQLFSYSHSIKISCEQFTMSQQDAPASDTAKSIETILPGCELILEINREVRDLIFNYTLWAAILGAFASNYLYLDRFSLPVLALIDLKMVLDIGTCWGRPEKKRLWAIAILFLLFLFALATALIVRFIFTIIGLFIPFIIVLNGTIGHGSLTFVMGKVANQFYLNSLKADPATLQRLLDLHQTQSTNELETR